MKRYFLLLLLAVFSLLGSAQAIQSRNITRLNWADDKQVLQFVKPYLPANPVIVEAGAYDGGDSALMGQFWPHGHVYAFEPVPELYIRLKQNTQSMRNVTCYQKALSDSDGRAMFYLSVWDKDPSRVSASSSLLPPKEHLIYSPDVYFPSSIEVETVTLDEWGKQAGVNHVDFLWLDMQGYELPMIMASELVKLARAIWMEVIFVEAYEKQYLFRDVYQWMEANGFILVATNLDLDNPTWFGDVLFVKK